LLRPDVVVFFRGTLYFITNFDYINTRSLYVKLQMKRDTTWLYHGNVMNSPFIGEVHESNILKYIPHEVCRGCKNIPDECDCETGNPKKGQK